MKKILPILLFSCASLTLGAANAATAESKASYSAAKSQADANYKVASAKCDALTGNQKDVCVAESKAARERAKQTAEAEYKNTDKARAEARKEIAEAEYKVAKAKCDALKGNEKDVCMKEAKATETAAKADAKAMARSGTNASTGASSSSATGASSGLNSGAMNDVKTNDARTGAKADTPANKTVIVTRNENLPSVNKANDAKRNAEYKVALEKCDAMSGPSKDACVAGAKTTYGK